MRHHSKNEKNRIQDQMLDVVTVVDDGDDARRAPCGESQLSQLTFLPPASLAQVKTGVFAAPQAQTNPSSCFKDSAHASNVSNQKAPLGPELPQLSGHNRIETLLSVRCAAKHLLATSVPCP
jgi:hypothetical protein